MNLFVQVPVVTLEVAAAANNQVSVCVHSKCTLFVPTFVTDMFFHGSRTVGESSMSFILLACTVNCDL